MKASGIASAAVVLSMFAAPSLGQQGAPQQPMSFFVTSIGLGDGALTTCNNWTSNGEGNAIVGHHDRLGGPSASWNSVHSSRGCSQDDLAASGGAGLFYCFAVE